MIEVYASPKESQHIPHGEVGELQRASGYRCRRFECRLEKERSTIPGFEGYETARANNRLYVYFRPYLHKYCRHPNWSVLSHTSRTTNQYGSNLKDQIRTATFMETIVNTYGILDIFPPNIPVLVY